MATVRRISPGKYTDGKHTVLAETKEEAAKKLAALSKPKKPKPAPGPSTPVTDIPVAAPVNPSTDQYVGLDILAGAGYLDECVTAYKILLKMNPLVVAGFFWVEFGSGRKLFEALYKIGVRVFRIQALWRSSHNYGAAEAKEALKYAAEIEAIKKSRPDCVIYFSPFCEHNRKRADQEKFFAELKKVAPSLIPVNSVWNGDYVPDSIALNEIHSLTKAPPPGKYIVSGDGCVGEDGGCGLADVDMDGKDGWNKRYASAHMRLGWALRFNKNEAKQPKIPPKDRLANCDPKVMLANYRILFPKGAMPSIAGAKPFPVGKRSHLWKVCSEDVYNKNKGKPESSRELRPVCIVPSGGVGRKAIIQNLSGKEISTSEGGLTYSAGGFRYYFSKLHGYEMSNAASAATKSEWCILVIGNDKFLLHPAFRTGYFRN